MGAGLESRAVVPPLDSRRPPRRVRQLLARLGLGLLAGCGGAADEARPGAPGPAPLGGPPKPGPLARELTGVARAIELRQFAEGRRLAEDYLAAHPGDAQATFLIGLSFALTDNHGAARPWFERALEREPGFVAVHELLASSLFRLGELARARHEYEAYSRGAPSDPKGPYGLGLIDLEESNLPAAQQRFEQALAHFAAIERGDPGQAAARRAERAECHARLGEVFFARGEFSAAKRELLRATELAPENISAFYTLGLVERRLGNELAAEEAARRYESARQALLAEQRAGTR